MLVGVGGATLALALVAPMLADSGGSDASQAAGTGGPAHVHERRAADGEAAVVHAPTG